MAIYETGVVHLDGDGLVASDIPWRLLPTPPNRDYLADGTLATTEARQRIRTTPVGDGQAEDRDYPATTEAHQSTTPAENGQASSKLVVEIPESTLTEPRSLFQHEAPELTSPLLRRVVDIPEKDALKALLEAYGHEQARQDAAEGFIELELNDFAVYVDAKLYPCELRPLQHLATRAASDKFYFDGTLSCNGVQYRVKKVPFRELPLGNYDIHEHSVGDQMWIRSEHNRQLGRDIYYKLGSPALEYRRFFTPFLWIADLAKHVVDYCHYVAERGGRIVLQDFRSRANMFLSSKHKSDVFRKWQSAHPDGDLRAALNANVDFIWKEAVGTLPRKEVDRHPFWAEIKGHYYKNNLSFADDVLEDEDGASLADNKPRKKIPSTIVTPYIYDMFAHMKFNNILKPMAPVGEEGRQSHMTWDTPLPLPSFSRERLPRANRELFIASIKPGDVIAVHPDQDSKWTSKLEVWYGLVQKVHRFRNRRNFELTWLYQPADTSCSLMKYPHEKELFLSEHCTCHNPDCPKGDPGIPQDQVISFVSVEWHGGPSTTAEFFVRQTFHDDHFVTATPEHMVCYHERALAEDEDPFPYRIGDTVLAKAGTAPTLETFEILQLPVGGRIRARRLLRRKDMASKSPLNELVYSQEVVELDVGQISRRCLVRVFGVGERIPPPYNRNGTGDAFFITHEMAGDEGLCRPVENSTVATLRQGFNPLRTSKSRKLRGLDLFCGGGNFGRGLEDGGAVEMKWANDIWAPAIHTYMANSKPDACKPLLGSADDLLYRALSGDKNVPRPGDVQFISGGSPCQGFSTLTSDTTTDAQRKNQSMIASWASFLDLYRPQYALLENVPAIVQGGDKQPECFFSQLLCAIVGMGYQVRIMYLDAWSFGDPQLRSRVFLSCAAPGLKLPDAPAPSHSDPPGPGWRSRRLGKMSNGMAFTQRSRNELDSSPFKYVSAAEATDLPDIGDAIPDYCVGRPDHRYAMGYTRGNRLQVAQIPLQPFGLNYSKVFFEHRTMPVADRDYFFPRLDRTRTREGAKGWGRVHPARLFSTITTSCQITDSRTGARLHWQQPRPVTVLEARRAQGFPDDEVVLGPPVAQWKIIGNSVARSVAVALGVRLREAWLGGLEDDDGGEGEGEVRRIGAVQTLAEDGSDIRAGGEVCRIGGGGAARVKTEVLVDVASSSRSSSDVPPSVFSVSKKTSQASTPVTGSKGTSRVSSPGSGEEEVTPRAAQVAGRDGPARGFGGLDGFGGDGLAGEAQQQQSVVALDPIPTPTPKPPESSGSGSARPRRASTRKRSAPEPAGLNSWTNGLGGEAQQQTVVSLDLTSSISPPESSGSGSARPRRASARKRSAPSPAVGSSWAKRSKISTPTNVGEVTTLQATAAGDALGIDGFDDLAVVDFDSPPRRLPPPEPERSESGRPRRASSNSNSSARKRVVPFVPMEGSPGKKVESLNHGLQMGRFWNRFK